MGCLTLSAQVCLYAPLFLISMLSVSSAFLPSRVVIPSPASLPPEISSNSSHLSHPLLPAATLQVPRGIRQGLHATRQGSTCLLSHPLLCPKRPAAGGIQLTTFCCLPGSWERSHLSPLPRQPASLARTNQGQRNWPQTLWGSCEPHATLLQRSHTRIPPNQQTSHHSPKPRGLFQTLPSPTPTAIERIVPSCELSCFVEAEDRSPAAQPSNTATEFFVYQLISSLKSSNRHT